MAHSLNNWKAGDFLKRTGNYSTHGSSRGFSDLGEKLGEIDFLPLEERHYILKQMLSKVLNENELYKNKQVKKLIREIQDKLSYVRNQLKTKNIEENNQRLMNKGLAFMKTAREVLDEDTYMAVISEMNKRYDDF